MRDERQEKRDRNRARRTSDREAKLCTSCRRQRTDGPPKCDECMDRARSKSGATGADRKRMLEAQGGMCKLCRRPCVHPVVDHCRTYGHIRGVICRTCNARLGLFQESPELLERAAQYVRENDGVIPHEVIDGA